MKKPFFNARPKNSRETFTSNQSKWQYSQEGMIEIQLTENIANLYHMARKEKGMLGLSMYQEHWVQSPVEDGGEDTK